MFTASQGNLIFQVRLGWSHSIDYSLVPFFFKKKIKDWIG